MRPYFVSFHPEIVMEENLPPFASVETLDVERLLRGARGVVLPRYVSPWRYQSITNLCRAWFPRLDARFRYCGKARQILLFRELGVRHPESLVFENPAHLVAQFRQTDFPWGYPLVLKGDTGGGGSSVFPIYSASDLERCARNLRSTEPALLQRWVDHGGKDLRVVVYGEHTLSYFRVGEGRFYNNVCRGGRIDHTGWPEEQERGGAAVLAFCKRAGIDIAGFDLMFPDEGPPTFIEINFHFGRKGLGGTPGHARQVLRAAEAWKAAQLKSGRDCPMC